MHGAYIIRGYSEHTCAPALLSEAAASEEDLLGQ